MLEHFPEVAGFRPFGDPLENFRKHEARESARGPRATNFDVCSISVKSGASIDPGRDVPTYL